MLPCKLAWLNPHHRLPPLPQQNHSRTRSTYPTLPSSEWMTIGWLGQTTDDGAVVVLSITTTRDTGALCFTITDIIIFATEYFVVDRLLWLLGLWMRWWNCFDLIIICKYHPVVYRLGWLSGRLDNEQRTRLLWLEQNVNIYRRTGIRGTKI